MFAGHEEPETTHTSRFFPTKCQLCTLEVWPLMLTLTLYGGGGVGGGGGRPRAGGVIGISGPAGTFSVSSFSVT